MGDFGNDDANGNKNVENVIGWKEQNNNSVRALNIILALLFAI